MSSLPTVFLGTSQFAASILERLAQSEFRPALILTRPDRPRGRGKQLASPPVAETARALEIPLEQPERINAPEVSERIALLKPRAVVVCAFGAIISEPLLSEHELINVHPSLLPRWRGAAPIERAIMAGDQQTGVSIMRITAGLDSGPVCLAASEPIEADDDYASLAERLQGLGGELLLNALEQSPPFVEQGEQDVTYAEKITAEDRLLDPSLSAVELERRVRALRPHVGARIALPNKTMLGVHDARVASEALANNAVGGALVNVDGQLLYGARDAALELLRVQPPGGRPMDGAAYLRGHGLPGG